MTRPLKIAISFFVAAFIFVLTFAAGIHVGSSTPLDSDKDFKAVQDAWQIITQDYIDRDNVDTQELSQAAIEAMLELIDDPYSAYLDPQAWKSSMQQLEGKYEGIGAEVTMEDERVVIVSPYAGSPAEEAGLKPGDIIMAVDGQPTDEMSHVDVVLMVRGPKGTEVSLTVFRPEEDREITFNVVRDEIREKSVRYNMVEDYAHITISSFVEHTSQDLGAALAEIEELGAKGIVLDLRNNPGGLVNPVVNSTSRFITEGVVFTSKYSDGREVVYEVTRQDKTTDLPMVVLVNNFSASGSEVLAGALQDYGRATIAGATTYGKGSVNVYAPIGADQGLHITVARWLTPNGNMIEGNGIEPDRKLELTGTDLLDWAIDYLGKS